MELGISTKIFAGINLLLLIAMTAVSIYIAVSLIRALKKYLNSK